MIRGSIDAVTTKFAFGWIYTDAQGEPLTVEATINHEVIGRAIASVARPDLAEAGFGSGNCGFELQFSNELDPLYLPFVRIIMAGSNLELPRWAGAGFGEYFQSLHERYPRSGRAASVYGGLWTDRTDSSAILKGRLDTGLILPRDANNIARFVQEGILAVSMVEEKKSNRLTPRQNGEVPGAIAATMFDDGMLRILRTILDDNPVAVRADVVDSDETMFQQISGLEDLPSPAECLGLIVPFGMQLTSVEVVRGGHRFPEFLPNGLSRWTHDAVGLVDGSLMPDMPIDRHQIPAEGVLLVAPGTIFRARGGVGRTIKVLVLPSRLSLLRFHKQPPRGELAHPTGARIWV